MIRNDMLTTATFNTIYRTAYAASVVLRPRAFSDPELLRFYIQTGIVIQDTMTGKMDGILSISTAASMNPICAKRAADILSVCHHCYALALQKGRKGLQAILERNYQILTSEIIPVDVWPLVSGKVRIESFGDLANVTQAINYLHFVLRNPAADFAWWTKNPAFIEKALHQLGIEKPHNLQIVLSCDRLNAEDDYCTRVLQRFPFIDRVFTVYDKEHAIDNDVAINCGERHCAECGACYNAGGPSRIREILKADTREYYAHKYGLYTTQDKAAAAVKKAVNVTKKAVVDAIRAAKDNDDIFAEIAYAGGRVIIGIERFGYSVAYAAA